MLKNQYIKTNKENCINFHINSETKFVIYPTMICNFTKNIYLRMHELKYYYYQEFDCFFEYNVKKQIDCQACKIAMNFIFSNKIYIWKNYYENSFYELFKLLFIIKNIIDYQEDVSNLILILFCKLTFFGLEPYKNDSNSTVLSLEEFSKLIA
jgi:hypothetical protein